MNLKPLPGRYLRRVGSAAFEDVIIEKDMPMVRLIGTETSAEDYRIFESGGDLLIQRNTGSTASPSWSNVIRYALGADRVEIYGHMVVTGNIQAPTITGPTIGDDQWTNANHNHTNAARGGTIPRTALRTSTAGASGNISGSSSVTVAPDAWSFSQMISSASPEDVVFEPHPIASTADNPRFRLRNTSVNIRAYDVQWRFLTT